MPSRRLPFSTAAGWSPGRADASRGVYFRCRICGSLAVLAGRVEPSIRCTTCGFDDHATNRWNGRRPLPRLAGITILAGGS